MLGVGKSKFNPASKQTAVNLGWLIFYSCPCFLVLSSGSPCKQTNQVCLSPLSSPTGFPFHCLTLLQETKKETGACQSEKGEGAHWQPKPWTSLDACSYPHHPHASKGCRIPPCNTWIDTNTWIFMSIQYLSSSFFSSKVPGGTLMMQVAGGTINYRCQWGEGVPAFAIHHPWGCTSSEPPAPAGRMLSDRTKGIGDRKSAEALNLCWNYGPSTKVSSAR